jgi:hypothetical protein
MFSIKKQHGKVVISKSVIPGANTGRQLAKSLLDNIKLRSALEQVKSEPEMPLVSSPITDTARDARIKAKVRAIIDGTPAKQSLDDMARESQIGYDKDSRFIIRNNNVPLLPTGCPNARIQKQIGDENVVRMANRMRAYTTYESWVNDNGDVQGNTADFTWQKYEEPAPKASSTAPAFIVKYGYYLLYDAGVCYYLSGNMVQPSVLKRLASEELSGETQNNSSILMSVSKGKYRNVSQSEYNSLITDTPSKEDLFKVFVQWDNVQKVLLDTSRAVPVWSKE